MRTEELTAGWLAQGRVPGAGVCDVRREVALPFLLADLRGACGREGLFLRAWELSREVARPAEPPRSHAERVLLTLDGVLGAGELFIGGKARGRLRPHMEVDLSEDLRGGPCRVALRFAPHLPRLYPGERGRELPVESKLLSARVRSVYRLRIEGVEVRGNLARVRLFAYGAGRVRLCLRLLAGEELLFSENVEVPVQVGSQVVERPVDRKGHAFAVLRVRADLAGEGCDEAEGFCGPEGEAHAFAHFFARPDEAMLQAARRAGFDAAALHVYPDEALRRACAQAGLIAVPQRAAVRRCTLLRADDGGEGAHAGDCLCAPLLREGPREEFAQAEKLLRAAGAQRAAGAAVRVQALCRQSDAQDGLFSPAGAPRQALCALRGALGGACIHIAGGRGPLLPGQAFAAELLLLLQPGEEGAAVVRAGLFLLDGTPVAQRSFATGASETVNRLGALRAQLPWDCRGGLLLRAQAWRGGALIAQAHAYYPLRGEDGAAQPFPAARLRVDEAGGVRFVCNDGKTAALGVTVRCGDRAVLRYGALLPLERVEVAKQGPIVVQYGNPI